MQKTLYACGDLLTDDEWWAHLPCDACRVFEAAAAPPPTKRAYPDGPEIIDGEKLTKLVAHQSLAGPDAESPSDFRPRPDALTGDGDFDDALRECVLIMRTKGHDYMGGSGDRLHNFREAARELGLDMRKVVYVYMWKHLAAIRSYCQGGELRSEDLLSRVTDSINYLLLLYKISREDAQDRAP